MQAHQDAATKTARFNVLPLAFMVSLSLGISPAFIPTALAAEPTQSSQQIKTYQIKAGSLDTVLNQFALAAGIELSIDATLTQGKTSSGLTGRFTTDQGLQQLLSAHNLNAIHSGSNVYTVKANSTVNSDEINLPVVKVSADRDGSWESGYAAKLSTMATKTTTSITETPQSISVVTRSEMDARGVRDIGDAAAYTAGVFSGNAGETSRYFGGNSIQIRGFGGNGTAGNSYNEYVDGLRMRGTLFADSNLDSYLFERVEVVKGPASVLYGQTQPGGVINTVSKRPSDDMQNEISLGTGNRDELTGAIDIGDRLNDNLLFRVTAKVIDGDTQQDPSDRERLLFAPSLTWEGENTSITFLAHYQKDDLNSTIQNSLPAAALFNNPNGKVSTDFRVGNPDFEKWERNVASIGYALTHNVNNAVTFRQNVRYTRNELESSWLYRRSLDADQRTLQRNAFVPTENADHFTIDNQLQWQFETGQVTHTLLGGVDYQNLSRDTDRFFGQSTSIDIFDPVYDESIAIPTAHIQSQDTTEKQLGIYLQDQIKIEKLSLLIGGRWDDARMNTENRLNGSEIKQDDDAFTGRAGAIYNFDNGLAPYVSYSESFEPVSGTAFDGSQFNPTEAYQYEVGIKYQPVDSSHLITLSWFDLTQKNVLTSDPNNPGFNIQTGEVNTRGFELESKTSFDNGLNLIAAYTYLDDEITKSNNGDEGERRGQIPKHTASLWADYTFNTGNFAGLGLGMGVRYIGETEFNGTVVSKVPSYTLVDASIRYDLGANMPSLEGWSVDAYVNNLFDKEYVSSCLNSNICYIGESQTFRMAIRRNW